MKVEKIIEVLTAYKEGKTIQRYTAKAEWVDANSELEEEKFFNPFDYNYRIKPDTEYRPYKTIDEFITGQCINGIWVKSKTTGQFHTIQSITKDSEIYISIIGWIDFQFLFDGFTWREGTPCGVKEGGEE